MIPVGATHRHSFYGNDTFYKKHVTYRMNEVSEMVQREVWWYYWTGKDWIMAGPGLRTNLFHKIKE